MKVLSLIRLRPMLKILRMRQRQILLRRRKLSNLLPKSKKQEIAVPKRQSKNRLARCLEGMRNLKIRTMMTL